MMKDLDTLDEIALNNLELGMENAIDALDALHLVEFTKVKLYRTSDVKGRGWNQYGDGPLRVKLIRRDDYQGWGQLTCHTHLTGAAGLNVLIVPNFAMLLSKNEPRRLTFKALSGNFGNNGKVNMYSLKMASSEDAARLWYIVFVLQLAASQARAGNPISFPTSGSVEVSVMRAFIGSNQEEVDRGVVLSSLGRLAYDNCAVFSTHSHQLAESRIGLPLDSVRSQELGRLEQNQHLLDTVEEEQENTLEVAVGTKVTNADLDGSNTIDGSEASSLGSYSDFPESQDWFAAFTPRETK